MKDWWNIGTATTAFLILQEITAKIIVHAFFGKAEDHGM
jgi:hypothetical protein